MDFFTYEKAKKRVKAKRKFYHHFFTWLIMSVFFILLNLVTNDRHFWAIFPILGWGLGLALHALKVFSIGLGDDWEEKELQKELERLQRKSANKKYIDPHVSDNEPLRQPLGNLRDSDFV